MTPRHHPGGAGDQQVVGAAGGTDNGAPGERPYHPDYYAAFAIDPDGNNIEAVCHLPAEAQP